MKKGDKFTEKAVVKPNMHKNLIRIAVLLLPIVLLFSLYGCEKREDVTPIFIKYTVTFVQEGYEDIVKEVVKGQTLTDIPTPQNDRAGYTAKWNKTDFTNIQESIIVETVYEVNEYKVYFDYEFDGSDISYLSYDSTEKMYYQKVTFDEYYSLYEVYKDDYTLLYYKEAGTDNLVQITDEQWKIPKNIVLQPEFIENSLINYSVVFFYGEDGTAQKTITKNIGEVIDKEIDGVPELPEETGYSYVWATLDGRRIISSFDEVLNENIALYVKKMPKAYTIHYSAGKKEDGSDYIMQYGNFREVNTFDQTVYYGQEYFLIHPNGYGFDFVKWIDLSTGETYRITDDIWTQMDDLYLEAVWEESDWTGYF